MRRSGHVAQFFPNQCGAVGVSKITRMSLGANGQIRGTEGLQSEYAWNGPSIPNFLYRREGRVIGCMLIRLFAGATCRLLEEVLNGFFISWLRHC